MIAVPGSPPPGGSAAPVAAASPSAGSDGGGREHQDVHTWFSLSYANYLVWPRSVMQSMPEDWQARFVALAEELDALMGGYLKNEYRVQRVVDGRFASEDVPHYNRGRTILEPRPGWPWSQDSNTPCPVCRGGGEVIYDHSENPASLCRECGGKGWIPPAVSP